MSFVSAFGKLMASLSSVGLLEVEPGIGHFLTSEERAAVSKEVSVPVATALRGDFTLVGNGKLFAAVVLEGMVLQRVRVGDRVSLRLLGPGDILGVGGTRHSPLLRQAECRAAVPSQLALLDSAVLSAIRSWPSLMAGLHARVGEQSERLVIQLLIGQLPSVEQRLLALMWLLAEWWGRVTPAGTTVPGVLAHEVLGELIGAPQSTVALALDELTERGAIVRVDGGWLLLEDPPEPAGEKPGIEKPRLIQDEPRSWARADERVEVDAASLAALRRTVVSFVDECRERRIRLASSRERCRLIRTQLHMRRQAGS